MTRAPAVSPAPASSVRPPSAGSARTELERQLETLLRTGVPAATGRSEEAFLDLLGPLGDALPASTPAGDDLPFVVVLPSSVVPANELVARMTLRGRPGCTSMTADELARFQPSDDLAVPDRPYLAVGVDTGPDTLGVSPEDALPAVLARGRTPLTLEEGLAVGLHFPDVLTDRNCFEMLGSRAGDRRVTGLWVRKGGAPRLGWCWVGAPHSWLGAASCAERRA
jgi:hypothetical protein